MSEEQQEATPKKSAAQDVFLESLAEHGIISLACKKAHINRSTFYRWKEKPQFKKLYDTALEDAKDNIKAEIYRRAHDGVEEPVYQLGKYCGTTTKYSDTLLIFHAKMLMPEYRDKQQVEHSGKIDIKTEWGGGQLGDDE